MTAADLRALLVAAREVSPVANLPETRTGALSGRTVATMIAPSPQSGPAEATHGVMSNSVLEVAT